MFSRNEKVGKGVNVTEQKFLDTQAELDTVHPDAPPTSSESVPQPPGTPGGIPPSPEDPPGVHGEQLEHRLLVGLLPVRVRLDQNVVLFLQAFCEAVASTDDGEPVYVDRPGSAQEASEPGESAIIWASASVLLIKACSSCAAVPRVVSGCTETCSAFVVCMWIESSMPA